MVDQNEGLPMGSGEIDFIIKISYFLHNFYSSLKLGTHVNSTNMEMDSKK